MEVVVVVVVQQWLVQCDRDVLTTKIDADLFS